MTGLDECTQDYVRSLWIAEDYDNYFISSQLFRFDIQFLEQLFPKPIKMVDLGCGTGRILLPFVRRGYEVTGVDLSDAMLKTTQLKLDQEGLSAELVKSNICRIPQLQEASFDAAVCMFSTVGMVRGSRNRLSIVREAQRVLRPGGTFVFHAHNFYYGGWKPEVWRTWFHSLMLTLFHGYEIGDKVLPVYRNIPKMYIHIFRPGEIHDLLHRAGFRLQHLIYLKHHRKNELDTVLFRTLRANGFIAVAEKVSVDV